MNCFDKRDISIIYENNFVVKNSWRISSFTRHSKNMKKLGALKEYAKKLGNYWAREDSNVKILFLPW